MRVSRVDFLNLERRSASTASDYRKSRKHSEDADETPFFSLLAPLFLKRASRRRLRRRSQNVQNPIRSKLATCFFSKKT